MKYVAFIAASVFATGASAATLTTTTVGDFGAGTKIIADFDTLNPATSGGLLAISPAAGIPNVAAPVGTDNFAYVVGGSSVSYSNLNARQLSFDAGSLDNYNVVTLSFTDRTSQRFEGPFGNFTPADSRRLVFTAASGAKIEGFTLQSGQNSFEFDNVGLAGVPEPSTWALMILGFGAVGGAMRRRQAAAKVSFA